MENEETVISDEQTGEETVTYEEGVTESTEESTEAKLSRAEAEANKWRRLFEKTQKPQSEAPQKAPQQLGVEEVVLLANGMPEDLLAKLKVIAQVNGSSLIKAQQDPVFKGIKENFEKDLKQKEASLPASRGSGTVKPKKDLTTPGLSREEHMALLKSQGLL